MSETQPPAKQEKKKELTFSVELCNEECTPTLEDVFGSKQFKESLEDVVKSMKYSQIYSMCGVKAPRSYLFTGSPGTGKTYVAKALANELAREVAPNLVAFMPYNIGKYGSPYINQGSVTLQGFFDSGMKTLLMTPQIHSIVYFMDEAESVMSTRGGRLSHKEDDKLLNTLMKNLQNIDDRCMNEYFIGCTNFPQALDKASIRSGRINQIINFPLPDYESRKALFEGYISKINTTAKYGLIKTKAYDTFAKRTNGLSCADIESLIDKSVHSEIKKVLKRPKEDLGGVWVYKKGIDKQIDLMHDRIIDKKREIGYNSRWS